MSGSLVKDSQTCKENGSSLDTRYRFWYLFWTFFLVLKTEGLKADFIIFLSYLKCLFLTIMWKSRLLNTAAVYQWKERIGLAEWL